MAYLDRLFPTQTQSTASGRTQSDPARKRSLPFKAPSRVEQASNERTAPSKATAAKAASKPSVASKAKEKVKTKPASKATAKSKGNGFQAASKATVISSDEDDSDAFDRPPPRKKTKPVVADSANESHSVEEEAELEEEPERSSDDEMVEAQPAPVRKPVARTLMSDTTQPIPAKLLTRLLYEGFEDKNMKIGREAMTVVGKYVETFVREALARAVHERQEADVDGQGFNDGFLQVEDLEKLAPQLLLDF